jgi:hypothetical protein
MANKLNIQNMEDWYHVSWADLNRFGGVKLLHYHGNSLHKALQTIYPNHAWKPFKFQNENTTNTNGFVSTLESHLGQRLNECYLYAQEYAQDNCSDLLTGKLNQSFYTYIQAIINLKSKPNLSQPRGVHHLLKTLKSIFPNEIICIYR